MERTLKKGMIGPEVFMLQETLNKHGYRVQTNGFFGIFTDEAVHNFQTRNGLVSDGIVGFRTRSAMGLDRLPVRQTGLLYHQRMGSNHPLGHPSNPSGPPQPGPLSGFFHNVSDVARRIGCDVSDFIHSALKASGATPKAPLVVKGEDKLQNIKGMHISKNGLQFIYTHEAWKGHSNRLHWPGGASGVTLGPGYDMKTKSGQQIKTDMMAIGLDSDTAEKISKASGLTKKDNKAQQFRDDNVNLVNLTEKQEMNLLILIIPKYEKDVKDYISVPLKQCQFDALVSYAYNPAYDFGQIMDLVNKGKTVDAMTQLKKRVKSGGKVMQSLVDRRNLEVKLYLYSDYGKLRKV